MSSPKHLDIEHIKNDKHLDIEAAVLHALEKIITVTSQTFTDQMLQNKTLVTRRPCRVPGE